MITCSRCHARHMREENDHTGRYWRCFTCGHVVYGADAPRPLPARPQPRQFDAESTTQQENRDRRVKETNRLLGLGLSAGMVAERLKVTTRTVYDYKNGRKRR